MITGVNTLNLADMIDELGEDKVKAILLEFSCPINEDVEYFIKNKAIEFSKRGWSRTHLVFTSYNKKLAFVGYFTLANKHILITKKALSKTSAKIIRSFTQYDNNQDGYFIAAPLLAQFSRNFSYDDKKLISGDDLMQIALDKVALIQYDLGGRVLYLECEDNEKLISFYERHGFIVSGKRILDRDETHIKGSYLIQMIKIMNRKKR